MTSKHNMFPTFSPAYQIGSRLPRLQMNPTASLFLHFFGAVYVSKWLRIDLAFTTTTIVTVVMVMVMILVIAKVLMLMMIYENGLWRSWRLMMTIIIMDSCCLPVFHGFSQPFQAASSQSRSSRPRRQPRSSLQRGPSWSFSKASLSWRFLISACRLCFFSDVVCAFSALAFAHVVLVVVWNSHGAYWTDINRPQPSIIIYNPCFMAHL